MANSDVPDIPAGVPAYTGDDFRNHCEDSGVPIIGISRHRLGIDGDGITTLVAFYGCRLRCKFCINPDCFDRRSNGKIYSPQSLLDELMNDDVYFRATGGGVTFGGGEPGLQTDFICTFKKICPPEWKIRIETSLQFHYQDTELLAPIIDEWIVDVKTAEHQSYREYTGGDYQQVIKNLHYLVDEFRVPKDKFVIRIPIIPGFTERNQAEETERKFREQGFTRFDIFEYQTERPTEYRTNGKAKCELLKTVRCEIAQANSIEYTARECSHQGDCPGTCPLCEMELANLSADLRKKGAHRIEISDETRRIINNLADAPDFDSIEGMETVHPGHILQGDIEPPLEGDITLESPRKKVLFKECAVAGISFHLKYDDEIWDELEAGQEVALVRDRKNKYDKNAVAIALADDYDGNPDDFDFDFILGYVPKTENAEIAKMLDMGWEDVFFTTLSTVKRNGNINDRLRISIFIQSKEPVKPETVRLYVPRLNEWVCTIHELEDRGTTHFRWDGFPTWEHNLPKLGTQIVVARDLGNRVVMFLMRVIAVGDDCIPFVDDPEIVNAVDDCVSFILANTNGPDIANKSDVDFIDKYLSNASYETELSQQDSDALKLYFHKQMLKYNEGNIDCDPSIDDPSLAD